MVFDDGVTSRLAERPLPHDHDHRQRGGGARLARGVAADRVAGAARPLHVGHRAVGDGGGRRARGRATSSARSRRSSRRAADFPFMTMREATVAGRAGAGVPDQLLRRAGLRDQRAAWHGLALWEAVLAAGRAVRHHAVRHRDDARAARREGLPDRRPGDRRHGHPHDLGHGLDRLEAQADSSASARSARPTPRGRTASSWSACCRSTRPSCCPRAPSWSTTRPRRAVPMVGHVTSSYRSAALGRTFALALVKAGGARIGERCTRRSRTRRSRRTITTPCCTTRRTAAVTADRRRARWLRGAPPKGVGCGGPASCRSSRRSTCASIPRDAERG